MIGGFGREDQWDARAALEPASSLVYETPSQEAVIPQPRTALEFSSKTWNSSEYYRSFVRSAIEQGGKFAGYRISVPWLRRILAGLEGRHIEEDEMWDGIGESGFDEPRLRPDNPSYNKLFPTRNDAPQYGPVWE